MLDPMATTSGAMARRPRRFTCTAGVGLWLRALFASGGSELAPMADYTFFVVNGAIPRTYILDSSPRTATRTVRAEGSGFFQPPQGVGRGDQQSGWVLPLDRGTAWTHVSNAWTCPDGSPARRGFLVVLVCRPFLSHPGGHRHFFHVRNPGACNPTPTRSEAQRADHGFEFAARVAMPLSRRHRGLTTPSERALH